MTRLIFYEPPAWTSEPYLTGLLVWPLCEAAVTKLLLPMRPALHPDLYVPGLQVDNCWADADTVVQRYAAFG